MLPDIVTDYPKNIQSIPVMKMNDVFRSRDFMRSLTHWSWPERRRFAGIRSTNGRNAGMPDVGGLP